MAEWRLRDYAFGIINTFSIPYPDQAPRETVAEIETGKALCGIPVDSARFQYTFIFSMFLFILLVVNCDHHLIHNRETFCLIEICGLRSHCHLIIYFVKVCVI